jgi:hypothetical protein
VVCRPNDHGGLGIHDLEVKNTALLAKWLFKLLTEDGVWKTLLKNVVDSHFLVVLMATKKYFFLFGSFSIN